MSSLSIPRKTFLILALLSLAFIWGQSLLPQSASSKESKWITQKVVQPTVNAVKATPSANPSSSETSPSAPQPASSGIHVPSGVNLAILTSGKATTSSVTEPKVRDLAHSLEYFAFAFFVALAVANPRKPYIPLLYCFTVAFLDESLQILSARGPQIEDVWLDLLGVAPAILLATLCLRLSRARTARKKAK